MLVSKPKTALSFHLFFTLLNKDVCKYISKLIGKNVDQGFVFKEIS